jgi:proline dehydrogenase
MLRDLLLSLSESPALKKFILSSKTARRVSRRFVAGEKLVEALAAAAAVNRQGMTATLDRLGENVNTVTEARDAAAAYLGIFDRIREAGVNSNVSIKLTQLGLDLDSNLCKCSVAEIAKRAESHGSFLRIDMEGSAHTERTLRLFREVHDHSQAVGIVIQAYLYRSEEDTRDLLKAGARIRLCKGAYKEPKEIAFPHKRQVNDNFVRLMKILLDSGIYHAVATHDRRMIDATINYAAQHKIGKNRFEFQMLYGIQRDLQQQLVRDGYPVRVYIPYGTEWFPYFMRRLAERPANVFFILKNILRR